MDPHYYARYSMPGWILAAVVVASAIERGVVSASAISGSMQNSNPILILIVSATIGIGAPPAVGFLFERLVSVLFTPFGGNMFNFDFLREFSSAIAVSGDGVKCGANRSHCGPEVFHLCFYAHAPEDLRSWARRRRTQLSASLSSAVAIVVGLIFSLWAWGGLGIRSTSIAIVFLALLVVHGWREGRYHRDVLRVWAESNTALLSVRSLPKLSNNIPK